MDKWFFFFAKYLSQIRIYVRCGGSCVLHPYTLTLGPPVSNVFFLCTLGIAPASLLQRDFLSLFVRPLYRVSFFSPFWSQCCARDEFHISIQIFGVYTVFYVDPQLERPEVKKRGPLRICTSVFISLSSPHVILGQNTNFLLSSVC